jgi:predicted nucleic acid-binding protein
LPAVVHHPIDFETAKKIGQMSAELEHADIVDVHVALLAIRFSAPVLTSDPDDMESLGLPPGVIIRV